MRLLITGASGFVGSHLVSALAGEYEITGSVFQSAGSPARHQVRVDLSVAADVAACLDGLNPSVIVHCAARSRVIGCEDDPTAATRLNLGATESIARWCRTHGAKLVYFSSDQVFDGRVGRYRPADQPDPINHYGRTKLAAEALVLDSDPRNTILRSNSVVGKSLGWGESFTDWVLQAVTRGATLACFVDQFRSPIHVRVMVALVQRVLAEDLRGVIHAGGDQRLNRAQTAGLALTAAQLGTERIRETSYRSHPRHEIMPADTSYDAGQMRDLLPASVRGDLLSDLARDYSSAALRA